MAVEQQAHGRTADIDRTLTIEQMAEDTAALARHLGFERADLFGYSLGAGIALQVAVRHPELVRKLVLVSVTYSAAGFQPGLLDGIEALKPDWPGPRGRKSTSGSRRTRTAGPRSWRR